MRITPLFCLRACTRSICAVVVAAVALLGVLVTGRASAATTTVYVSDNFNRTVSAGLGSAATGGAYSYAGGGAGSMSVKPGQAMIRNLAASKSQTAYIPSRSISDPQTKVTFTFAQASTALSGLTVGVIGRRQADASQYRAKLTFTKNGHAALSFARAAATQVETSLTYLPLTWSLPANTPVNVEMAVTGTNPVVIRGRAWPAAQKTPAWQLTYSDSSSTRIGAAGDIGLWAYRSGTAAVTGFTSSVLYSQAAYAPGGTVTTLPPTPLGDTPATTSTAGSVQPGQSAYTFPANSYFVSPTGSNSAAGTLTAPWQTIGYASSKAPAGATIVVRAGVYHESVTIARANQTIQAYPHEAVWLDGSSAVTGWVQHGSTWVHSNWGVQFDHSLGFTTGEDDTSFLDPAYPMAGWPDQVFLDGTSLQQVAAGSAVGAGEFAVSYSAKTLTIGSNPTGHQMRASDLEIGVTMQTTGQRLLGIGVRRYATPMPSLGAVRLFGGSDTLDNVVVTQNATEGITNYRSNNHLISVTATYNGLAGIQGDEADGLVISHSLSAYNNAEHFHPSPSAAGVKITKTKGLTVSSSVIMNNLANGVWLDESDRQFSIVNNTIVNDRLAIQAELSDTGVIANNVLTGGEYGIWLHDTGDVQIYNNAISKTWHRAIALMQDDRRQATDPVGRDPRAPVPDPSDPWLIRNIDISNNTFDNSGDWQIWAIDLQTHIPVDKMNVSIDGNLFSYAGATALPIMVAWGQSDNTTFVNYTTVAALQAAKPTTRNNMQTTTGARSATRVSALAVSDSNAKALPSNIAALIGSTTGTQHLGCF